MSTNCLPVNCDQDVPVPTPTPLPPCEDGEACKEVTDAACVVYTNEPLPAVNVETNDRLNDIIRKWAQTVDSGTQAISGQQTLTTSLQGNGTSVNPLKVNVRVSTYPGNLLQVVDYNDETSVHRTGLQVVITKDIISWILVQIAQTEELKTQFCEIIDLCSANACRISTGLVVEVT